jgi:hypothetical protein
MDVSLVLPKTSQSLTTQQAASVFCLPGQLLHLSFYPQLSPGLLPLPQSLAIVITNSLEPHALSEHAPERYNLRVFETLCAVRLLLRDWNFDRDLGSPSCVEQTGRVWFREALHLLSDKLGLSEEEAYVKISKDIERVLGSDGRDKQGWTKKDIIQASGMPEEQFNNTFTKTLQGEQLSHCRIRCLIVSPSEYFPSLQTSQTHDSGVPAGYRVPPCLRSSSQ